MRRRGAWACVLGLSGIAAALGLAAGSGCGNEFTSGTGATAGASATGGGGETGLTGGQGGGGHGLGGGGTAGTGGTGGGPACSPPTTEACYDGPAETQGVGTCHDGTRTCNADGQWGACEGEQLPQVEDCKAPHDEDCNGVVCSAPLWSAMAGGVGEDLAVSVAFDSLRNVAVAGTFHGTLSLAPVTLTSHGGADGFVLMFDPNGAPLWGLAIGGQGDDHATGVAFDSQDKLLVTGWFVGQAVVDDGHTIAAGGAEDGFLAKIATSQAPHVEWANHLGTAVGVTGSKHPLALAVDGAGDVVIVGSNTGHWACGVPTCDTAPVGLEAFVDKHSGSDGSLLWRVRWDSVGDQVADAVTVLGGDSPVVGGSFYQQINVGGPLYVTPDDLTRYGFVARLAGATGDTTWALSLGDGATSTDQTVTAVAACPNGDIALAGFGSRAVAFDNSLVVPGSNDPNVLVGRYGADGSVVWGHVYGDVAPQHALAVAVDSHDQIVVAGANAGSINFGDGQLVTTGVDDVFLTKLTADGQGAVWSKGFGGVFPDRASAVAVNALDQIAIAGDAGSSLNFGSGPLVFGGAQDAFVALFQP